MLQAIYISRVSRRRMLIHICAHSKPIPISLCPHILIEEYFIKLKENMVHHSTMVCLYIYIYIYIYIWQVRRYSITYYIIS